MAKNNCTAVILVNYKQPTKTLRCLASLAQLNLPAGHHVSSYVVDNASGEGSLKLLRRYQNTPGYMFQLIESEHNLGFAGGVNLGIQAAQAQWGQALHSVWLLNNDTTTHPDALLAMLEALNAPEPGPRAVIGSKLVYPDGRFQQAGIELNLYTAGARGLREPKKDAPLRVNAISGASMLIPADVLETLGPLDEQYFLYFEDIAYCLKAQQANIPCWLAPRSRVYHTEGAATGKGSLLASYYAERNRLWLVQHYGSRLQQKTAQLYTRFRLWRSGQKAKKHPERADWARIQQLAVQHFHQGITGPCPTPEVFTKISPTD
ncbi:MAG: glycosyltransferase family 2 protein [Vampirovibrionales bacterium]|nr:glycosyltransferase family 2 protein [Vampirovibrionales bacterium]